MTQDFLRCAKSDFRRNTVCIARKSDKAQHKKDKSGSVLDVSEEVYYTAEHRERRTCFSVGKAIAKIEYEKYQKAEKKCF